MRVDGEEFNARRQVDQADLVLVTLAAHDSGKRLDIHLHAMPTDRYRMSFTCGLGGLLRKMFGLQNPQDVTPVGLWKFGS